MPALNKDRYPPNDNDIRLAYALLELIKIIKENSCQNMALIKNVSVNIIETKIVEFKDKLDPTKIVKKFKYTCLDSEGTIFALYSDKDRGFKEVNVAGFDDKLAISLTLKGKEWDGETKWSLA